MALIAPVPQVRRATTRATTTTTITCLQSPSVTAGSRTRCLRTELPCSLITADEPGCQSYARVTIVDSEGGRGLRVSSSRCRRARRHHRRSWRAERSRAVQNVLAERTAACL